MPCSSSERASSCPVEPVRKPSGEVVNVFQVDQWLSVDSHSLAELAAQAWESGAGWRGKRIRSPRWLPRPSLIISGHAATDRCHDQKPPPAVAAVLAALAGCQRNDADTTPGTDAAATRPRLPRLFLRAGPWRAAPAAGCQAEALAYCWQSTR